MLKNRSKIMSLIILSSIPYFIGCSKTVDCGYDFETNVLIQHAIENDDSISESGVGIKRKEQEDLQKSINVIIADLDNQNINILKPINKTSAANKIYQYALEQFGVNIKMIDENNVGDNGTEYYANVIDSMTNELLGAIKIDSVSGELIEIIE